MQSVALLEGKLRLIAERDQPPDYIVVVISDELLRRCGVADYFGKAAGTVHRDLRRAVKAAAMKYQIPTQLLREYVIQGRDPTSPAKIAWNFFTGLYHKREGFRGLPPAWRLARVSLASLLTDELELTTTRCRPASCRHSTSMGMASSSEVTSPSGIPRRKEAGPLT